MLHEGKILPNTYLIHKGKLTEIVFYKTDIVTFTLDEIILNTGNWWTAITKSRMNKISENFNLGYKVQQKDEEWFVLYKGDTHPFTSVKMMLNRQTGEVNACKVE